MRGYDTNEKKRNFTYSFNNNGDSYFFGINGGSCGYITKTCVYVKKYN